jgi:hypothetical protein
MIVGGDIRSNEMTSETPVNDIWWFALASMQWTMIRPSVNSPPGREYMAAGLIGTSLFVFGGRAFDGRLLSDTWQGSFTVSEDDMFDIKVRIRFTLCSSCVFLVRFHDKQHFLLFLLFVYLDCLSGHRSVSHRRRNRRHATIPLPVVGQVFCIFTVA